ncbi:MAG: hypothetical protein HY820_36225 [Acidobacteria bacterium]|nr:hypothetical protein [Acidobacteriota bacterium]
MTRAMRIVALLCGSLSAWADEPPAGLLRRVLERETVTEEQRANYAYRQKVHIEELEPGGRKRGEYREARDVIFSPEGKRFEQLVGKPFRSLDRLVLTEEDFRDIREVQPFLFTRDSLPMYQTKYKGEDTTAGFRCWLLQVSPRQILDGQRLFEGLIWVHQQDLAVIRMEGRAVPQMLGKKENLFPRFVTVRKLVDGKFWFPEKTSADDVLQFRSGALRMKMAIDYETYKRFGAESTVTFDLK